MQTPLVLEFPPFAAFYRATNFGREPFPWQRRLAEEVMTDGWPAEIGVPTGLGKTSSIDVAVWSLAAQAATRGETRDAPTRVWYVVNRRILVDAAWERGRHLAKILGDPASLFCSWPEARPEDIEVLRATAEALRAVTAFGSDRGPLHIARLRGGADLGVRAPDPSQPTLVFATVPMFASRWLFRGYGSSTSMRPVDAALAGIDALVLLDEAHLARPLARLAGLIPACDAGDPSSVLPGIRARPVFVALTATGEGGRRFDLDDEDRANPVVCRRLHAAKPVTPVPTTGRDLPTALADCCVDLLAVREEFGSCVVFVNTTRTARTVAAVLGCRLNNGSGRASTVLLLTGRTRDREAEVLRRRILDVAEGSPAGRTESLARSGRPPDRTADLVVVATQTLEVGADLDFDHLVTETAGVRALVQRLGRLNRLGTCPKASAVVCHPDGRKQWPVYGAEPQAVWERLMAAADDGPLDLGPSNAGRVLGDPSDEPPRVGELLPFHLEQWAKTSPQPPDEAPPELFFTGFEEGGDVTVVWRARVPVDGVRLTPPLTAAEAIDIPVRELREALHDLGLVQVQRLAEDKASLETVPTAALAPGDEVHLPASCGLYDEQGWNPEARDPVLDVSALGSGVLHLHEDAIGNLVPDSPSEVIGALHALRGAGQPDAQLDPEEEGKLARELLGALRVSTPHPWLADDEWQAFLEALQPIVARPVDDEPYLTRAAAGIERVGIRTEAFDELSFIAASRTLPEHLGSVGEVAALIAKRLRCSADIVRAVELAGKLHDTGKADARFQRWLDPEAKAQGPLAKSGLPPWRLEAARTAAGWPRGGRHELLSVRVASAWLTSRDSQCDWDLLLHLIASHHGQGRPMIQTVNDPAPPLLMSDVWADSIAVSGDLSIPDWDQPARFRTVCCRYGYWGVALLEAVLRQADHAVSNISDIV